jgi:glycosyltransferase involved in cell wall biosynthesis
MIEAIILHFIIHGTFKFYIASSGKCLVCDLHMKLVVMIPTRNEELTIGKVIDEIPKQIEGINEIEIIIIDGASTDDTIEVAIKAGAAYAYSDQINRGLASAFKIGLQKALQRGADNQTEIPQLIKPIINREADMVLGSRFKGWIEDMPLRKKIGNRLATFVTSKLAGQRISDAQSGFRAIHRELALRLIVEAKKTYVQETLIRPIRMGYTIVEIPIRFRKRDDKSRLILSIWSYALRVFPDLFLTYLQVAALRFFVGFSLLAIAIIAPIIIISLLLFIAGAITSLAYLWDILVMLIPSILILLGIGLVMDYQSKIRMRQIEIEALKET